MMRSRCTRHRDRDRGDRCRHACGRLSGSPLQTAQLRAFGEGRVRHPVEVRDPADSASPRMVLLGIPVSRAISQSFQSARDQLKDEGDFCSRPHFATLLRACPSGEIGILRWIQNPLPARACGFESRLGHPREEPSATRTHVRVPRAGSVDNADGSWVGAATMPFPLRIHRRFGSCATRPHDGSTWSRSCTASGSPTPTGGSRTPRPTRPRRGARPRTSCWASGWRGGRGGRRCGSGWSGCSGRGWCRCRRSGASGRSSSGAAATSSTRCCWSGRPTGPSGP